MPRAIRKGSARPGKRLMTHRALRIAGLPDNGVMSVANSTNSCIAHWFKMDSIETSPISGKSTVKDSITNVIVENNDASHAGVLAGDATGSLKCEMETANVFPGSYCPETCDRIIFSVARCVLENPGAIPYAGGHIAFVCSSVLRSRQGRVSYNNPPTLRTLTFCAGMKPDHGTDYVFAGVERLGDRIEHYGYHDRKGKTILVDWTAINENNDHDLWVKADRRGNDGFNNDDVWFSHGFTRTEKDDDSLGDCPGEGASDDNALTDYFGAMVLHIRREDMPDSEELARGLEWMRVEWAKNNKVLYPGFVTCRGFDHRAPIHDSNINPASGTVGVAYNESLAGHFSGDATSYEMYDTDYNWPSWATFNEKTGVITGTPDSAGTTQVAVRALNEYGDSAFSYFNIVINAA